MSELSQINQWVSVAEQIGGTFFPGHPMASSRIELRHEHWIITLDTFHQPGDVTMLDFTRMRAPFITKDEFRFGIYRKTLLSGLGKLFGLQDIELGIPQFDDVFVIKGSDDAKVKVLFSNYRIRDLVEAQPDILFKIKDDDGFFGKTYPKELDELYFEAAGVINDPAQLKSLFSLFTESLNTLVEVGGAAPADPGFHLYV